jgi:hypothetical protein
MDWKLMRDELAGIIEESLAELVEGAREDLKAYGAEIARNLIVAIRLGRADLREELQQQFVMLGEIHRIRFNNEAENVMRKTIDIAVRVGKAAVGL